MIIHLAARPDALHRRFKFGVNQRIFIVVLDLIAALFDALVNVRLAAGLRLVAAPADGEKKHRFGAAVEMLMEPHFRRHEHAARPPLDALQRLSSCHRIE